MTEQNRKDIRVNGVVIDWNRVSAEAQNHGAAGGRWMDAWAAAARALVTRELLLQEARQRNISAEPHEISSGRWETEEEAAIRQLLDECLIPEPIAEADLMALYRARPERFRAPPLWQVSHILFAASQEQAVRAMAKTAAQNVLAQVLENPKRFAELASRYSACSSAQNGGQLGQISPGDTVAEFENALRALKAGEISAQPVESKFGFHIIRLDAVSVGAVLPFSTLLPRLKEAAEKSAWARACQIFTRELWAKADIVGPIAAV